MTVLDTDKLDGLRARLGELRAVARALWTDRDDARVMSELVIVLGQIRKAEDEVKRATGSTEVD